MRRFFSHTPVAAILFASLMIVSSGCNDDGAGVRKDGAMMSDEDVKAKLAAQKSEVEAMFAEKEKTQTQTIENMQQARAEAIELAEKNAETKLAEKSAEFEATISALNDELNKVKESTDQVGEKLAAQDKRIDQISAKSGTQIHDLPYSAISVKHEDLINKTLSMQQFNFDQVDAEGMLNVYPNQVIQLVSAIDDSAVALQPYKQDIDEILIGIVDAHHQGFEESPSTVLIEAKIRRAHIHLWTERGQVYMAALSREHPETFITWLQRLNEEGLFGDPKAIVMQTPEMITVKVADEVSTLVPLDQHVNQALFSFLKKATTSSATAFGFVATPVVGQKVQAQTQSVNTYIEASALVQRAQKLNNESFQLVLTDKRDA